MTEEERQAFRQEARLPSSGDARVDSLMERIREQCEKGQYWNALALGLELQRRLMELFDARLKE